MDQFKLDTDLLDFYGFKFEYHKNDNMAKNSIKSGKMWEPHITNFVKLYNSFYNNTSLYLIISILLLS